MQKKKAVTAPKSTGELEAQSLPVWIPDHVLRGVDGKPAEPSQEHREAIAKAQSEREAWLKPKPILTGKKIEFDEVSGIISIGILHSDPIKKGTNMAQLCKAVFDPSIKPGDWLEETSVIDTFYRGKRSARSFYDTIRDVNEILENLTGVEKILEYDASRVRTRVELFG